MVEILQLIGIAIFLAGAAGLLATWKVPSIGMFWAKREDKKPAYAAYACIAVIGILAVVFAPGAVTQVISPSPTPAPTAVPTIIVSPLPTASNGETQQQIEDALKAALAVEPGQEAVVANDLAVRAGLPYQQSLKHWFAGARPHFVTMVATYDTINKYAVLDKEFYPVDSEMWKALDHYSNLAVIEKTKALVDFNSLVDNFNACWGYSLGLEERI